MGIRITLITGEPKTAKRETEMSDEGMLCDRCGDISVGFHEDYGNFCQACSIHWNSFDAFTPLAPREDEPIEN